MFRICIVSSLLVAAVCGFRGTIGVEDAKEMISKAGDYLKSHDLTQIQLPNIGILPLDAVKLRKGVLEGFDTIKSLEDPVITKKENSDGSTTFRFDVMLGLDQLKFQYNFMMGVLGGVMGQSKGVLSLQIMDNEIMASGVIVMGKDNSCDVMLQKASILKMGDNKLTITPKSIPKLSTISEKILNFIEPKLIPVTNMVFEALVLKPKFQEGFADFVCQQVKQ